jgi:hypothetical protein
MRKPGSAMMAAGNDFTTENENGPNGGVRRCPA